MNEPVKKSNSEVVGLTSLYHEHAEWNVNSGETTIHAKRMPGRFRTLKYITESFWLIFFWSLSALGR